MSTHQLLQSQVAVTLTRLPLEPRTVRIVIPPDLQACSLHLHERTQVSHGNLVCTVHDTRKGYYVTLDDIASGGLLFANLAGLIEFMHAHYPATLRQ
jgi:hypothetical protein